MSQLTIKQGPILWALLAAVLYGISLPISKQLLVYVSPLMLAAFLYLGAGTGMLLINAGRRLLKASATEARLTRRELPFIMLMVLLDILAPILLMLGLNQTSAAHASLLNNFEIVATAFIALVVFREAIGRRQWLTILLVTVASILLSIEDFSAFTFSAGSLYVLLACTCWGFENNCTRKLSIKDPAQIVLIKGLGSGCGALGLALIVGEVLPQLTYVLLAMLLGFVAYGLSIYCYVKAQRALGASRTSAFYAVTPFIGAAVSILAFGEQSTPAYYVAAAMMLLGVGLSITEQHRHQHLHGGITHEHRHTHEDEHHRHAHQLPCPEAHSHAHVHLPLQHSHEHRPDTHHEHSHS